MISVACGLFSVKKDTEAAVLVLTEFALMLLRDTGLEFVRWGYEIRKLFSPRELASAGAALIKVPRIMIKKRPRRLRKLFPSKGHTAVMLPDQLLPGTPVSLPFMISFTKAPAKSPEQKNSPAAQAAAAGMLCEALRGFTLSSRRSRPYVTSFIAFDRSALASADRSTERRPEVSAFWAKLASAVNAAPQAHPR